MNGKHRLIASAVALAAGFAHASDAEIRVLGPAWSHHFSQRGALIEVGDVASWECSARTNTTLTWVWNPGEGTRLAAPFTVQAGEGAAGAITSALEGKGELAGLPRPAIVSLEIAGDKLTAIAKAPALPGSDMHGSALVNCDGERSRRARWHQANPALGLEYTWRRSGYADRAFATVVRDSYGQMSLMAGGARLWPLAAPGTVLIEAGVAAGLWWRSDLKTETTTDMRVVPFVLPSLSVTERSTGLGLNLALMPRSRILGRQVTSTTVAMVQLTYLIGGRHRVSMSESAGATQVSYSTDF